MSKLALAFVAVMMGLAGSSLPGKADDFARGVPSQDALKTRMALKLAGLVTFVAGSCPELRTDYKRFKTAIEALGVSTSDLEDKDKKADYLAYALRYQQNVKASCTRARDGFGPNGDTVSDIFAAKAP